MTKRVDEWTRRLEPILQAQEEAAPFDIHEYSDNILSDIKVITLQQQREQKSMKKNKNMMKIKDENIAFNHIASGRSSAEVCRMFLACLQLANLGNIDVIPPAATVSHNQYECNASIAPEIFQVRLLAEERHKAIDSFRAPSIMDENTPPQIMA